MTPIDDHFKRALAYVRPYVGSLVPVVVVSLLSTGLSLVLPFLSKVLVDDAILGQDFSLLLRLVGLFIAIPLVSFGMNVFSGMRYTRVSADILFDMRLDLYRHLQRLSPRYYARTQLGDIVTRINGDIGEIQRVVSEAALSWFGQVIALIGTVGMLIYLDWKLFLASLLVVPPSLFTLVRYRRELEVRVTRLRERSSEIGSFLIETLQGMRTVVGANAQNREVERFRGRNDAFIDALLSMRLYTYVAGGLPGLLLTSGTALVFLYGGYRVIEGIMTLGTLVAFMAYQARLMTPVQGLMGIYTNLATARASLVRVHEVLDATPDVVEVASPERMSTCRGEIRLEAISFDFGRGVEGLSDVDLHIPGGEVLAIVGASGSGKSTLADLLERHLDPQEGRVLLDGVDLAALSLEDVRRHIGVVPQDPFIFHASVEDNVRYADPEANDDDVMTAIDAAGLRSLLARLPDGVRTVVGERGRQLSAGERQRLAIARAFLADPAILVMDEATGALDPSSEAAVLDGYDRIMKGRTTILITHRLDLARQAERVVVMEKGRIVEDGPPTVLEREGSAFRELFLDVLAG
ncbi:MAG: ABC transporter ATP-binding protein [Gemmatimonadota bacterium]|nr:ABC transporter ATP-binding protein [Gemmatimonadota bacterium]MDE3005934.1 ABC transporter ATP-binding protein [Gemmatimonadota bacterium]MDE3014592.1 ABC transporter ATP-binding protein [Gemmatimonadota bacterium]